MKTWIPNIFKELLILMKYQQFSSQAWLSLWLILMSLSTNIVNASTEKADLILRNGVIYTVDKAQSQAESVAVKEGNILFVGSNSEVVQYQDEQTRIIELEGRMVLPGFHDSHLHPLEAGSEVGSTCDLKTVSDESSFKNFPKNVIATLRECAPYQKGTQWILGGGHYISTLFDLLDSGQSPLAILDEAIPDKPVAMLEETSHSLWINSVAWQQAVQQGIFNEEDINVPGGIVYRDDAGKFTGILFENAGNRVLDIAFTPSKELNNLNYEGLLYGLEILAQHGITSMVDARTYWQRGHLDVWKRAESEGKLTARAVLSLWAYPHLGDELQIEKLKSMYQNNADSLLRVSQVKVYSDGIVGNGTAALLEPYQASFGITDEDKGLNYFEESRLTHYVTELEKVGFDMHIHTIGDRAVRESLNAIEAAQKTNGNIMRRHRLTHLELIHPDDRPRFAQLGVIADFQLAGEFTEPKHAKAENQPLIGERASDMFPVKNLYDTGTTITLSSDWDVSEISPFLGIERALKQNKLPNLESAIRAYTINAAFLMRQENLTGSIEVGKYADLIVIDQNLSEIPVGKIDETTVLLTLLAGKEVYRHPDFSCGSFDAVTNLLLLPEVDAMSLGVYSVNLKLVGSDPIIFELLSATPVTASGNSCAAHFDGTTGKLEIPVVKVGGKRYLANLARENIADVFRFSLDFLEEIKLL
jgi:predicted amidohydrolase YtcJ